MGILGDGILLRALSQEDMVALHSFVNDPEVMQYSNVYYPIDDLRQQRWFERISASDNSFWFGITEQATAVNRLIGTCCLVDIDWISRLAEFRIRIGDKQAWGRGFGTKASYLLMRYAFEDLNLERIWLRVFSSNGRAIHMYENLGFQVEGTLRRAAVIKGQVQDVILMGVLREEWNKQDDLHEAKRNT